MLEIPKIRLSDNLEISRLVHGHWRLAEWDLTPVELHKLTVRLLEMGITTFDHADIYGDYRCEKLFGDALSKDRALQDNIQIVTKCGIKLMSHRYPKRQIKTYDYSYDHIITSVENSLKNFRREYIDLLLFHRPAPFFNPHEVAKAMDDLHKDGKVLNFGVSNFSSLQYEMLQTHSRFKLVTNQVELSPYCLEHFENGNIDFFLKEEIHPMAWSPLAGGKIFRQSDPRSVRIMDEIHMIKEEMAAEVAEEVIFAWLLKHPAGFIPVIGSGRKDRIMHAANAIKLDMSLEQWYRIYNASKGEELP